MNRKSILKKIGSIFLFIALGWFWGVQTITEEVFPYQYTMETKKKLSNIGNSLKPLPAKFDESSLKELASFAQSRLAHIKINGIKLRERMKQTAVFPIEEMTLDIQPGAEGEEVISTSLYGVTVHGVLAKSNTTGSIKCLVIYNQGHGGKPSQFEYYKQFRQKTLDKGCDLLSFSMIGIGLNAGETHFPSRTIGIGKSIFLTKKESSRHQNYAHFYDSQRPSLGPISLFISGHYKIIKELAHSYETISMVGISGGGWHTTVLSSLIPDIKVSISVAGSLPLYFRTEKKNMGDYEQVFAPFWLKYDYWDLYYLGRVDDGGMFNRSAYLIFNENDPCCFKDPSASILKSILDEDGGVSVIVDQNPHHSINVELVFGILEKHFFKNQ